MFSSVIVDRPSLKILNALREHDDFMESISTLVDLGCGTGQDLAWWATQTTREDSPQPLNIRCIGVDLLDQLAMAKDHANVSYQRGDFETEVYPPKDKFDVLWCHDSFQYCLDPLGTLVKWRDIASAGAMLVLAVPETITIKGKQVSCHLPTGNYYHHTMVSLMYMLATAGWNCRDGFFQQQSNDPWIRAVIYATEQPARDPKHTTWYDLLDSKLLPESAEKSIHAHGFLRQQDLILPWLDHNLAWFGKL